MEGEVEMACEERAAAAASLEREPEGKEVEEVERLRGGN
jgi:hypothetical protein